MKATEKREKEPKNEVTSGFWSIYDKRSIVLLWSVLYESRLIEIEWPP